MPSVAYKVFRYLLENGNTDTKKMVMDILRQQHRMRFPQTCHSEVQHLST